MLVYPTNPPGIELYYNANVFFCFGGKTRLLITCVKNTLPPATQAITFPYVYHINPVDKPISLLAIKDGAYYCYCAYVLRISKYSGLLSVMLTNTGIFLSGLKPSVESRSY